MCSSIRSPQLAESFAQSCPSGTRSSGSLAEFRADLVERHADPLGEDDERDPPQHIPPVAPVPGSRPFGPDEAALLVETQRGRGDAAAAGHLGDGEQVGHARNSTRLPPLLQVNLNL